MWWIVKNTWPGHDMLLMTISCLVADAVSKSSSSVVFSFGRLFYVDMEDGSDDEDISWVLGCKEGIRQGMCLFAGLCCLVDAF